MADEQFMADLWDRIPEELRDKIIAHIPSPKKFELRSVCKHWNSLISCPRFLFFCSSISPIPNPWILIPKWPSYNGFLAFIPESQKWLSIPMRFSGLPTNLHVESSMYHHGNGNLLLLRTPNYSFPQKLHIYSPLLQISHRVLQCPPSLIRGTSVLLSYEVSRERGMLGQAVFCILGVARASGGLQAISYVSETDSWHENGGIVENVESSGTRSSILLVGGDGLLVLGKKSSGQALFMYMIQDRKWVEVELPDSGLEMENFVVQCGTEGVFLVQVNGIERKMSILRLEMGFMRGKRGFVGKEKVWVTEVERVEMEERFYIEDDKGAIVEDCVGIDTKIVFYKMPNMLCYDVKKKIWEWLPCVGEKVECMKRVFAYCPVL